MLFDIPKNAVFVEILGFSNIFGFPAVNSTPKCTKTVNFGYIPFEAKCKLLKDLSKTLSYRRLALVKISADRTVFAPKNPKRGQFIDAESIQKTLKVFHFTTTSAILMKLTTIQNLVNYYLAQLCNLVQNLQMFLHT